MHSMRTFVDSSVLVAVLAGTTAIIALSQVVNAPVERPDAHQGVERATGPSLRKSLDAMNRGGNVIRCAIDDCFDDR